jgi:hypothetical protein
LASSRFDGPLGSRCRQKIVLEGDNSGDEVDPLQLQLGEKRLHILYGDHLLSPDHGSRRRIDRVGEWLFQNTSGILQPAVDQLSISIGRQPGLLLLEVRVQKEWRWMLKSPV